MRMTEEQLQQEADDAWSDRPGKSSGQAWTVGDYWIWRGQAVIRPFNVKGPKGFVGSYKTLEAAKAKCKELLDARTTLIDTA